MKECVSCKGPSNVLIKSIGFCSTCFKANILRKVRKIIKPYLIKEKILIPFNGSVASIVTIDILLHILDCRINQPTIYIFQTNKNKLNTTDSIFKKFHKIFFISEEDNKIGKNDDLVFNCKYNLIIDGNSRFNMILIAKKYRIPIVIDTSSVDDLSSVVISGVSYGLGATIKPIVALKEDVCNKDYAVVILRILSSLSDKEIYFYYHFISENRLESKTQNYTDSFVYTKKFLYNLCINNYSTSYSVIETIRKINSNYELCNNCLFYYKEDSICGCSTHNT
ncbi:Cytoplasmic tRNA 2-thiolation protein 2 [Astathelohania contejeani]|uniref:Cytoplasmic tRNA 2-thiolation protein 2 n=1 Tax=Astathelohania contejeani TaxID=164912 RepID=A0ABQ7HZR7_9MICR|nr:Cytoplasmic tRNA 2-thiolation protein 2 [Thelohania contejeani]